MSLTPDSAPQTPVDTIAIANDPARSEADWYQHVYQGDKVPQLTVRAVLMGGALGMLMSAANLYTTLKIGWSFGVAITACVLSYVIWNAFRILSFGRMSGRYHTASPRTPATSRRKTTRRVNFAQMPRSTFIRAS